MKKMKRAFTLIELLVVVAIIGILATVVIINVSGARAKATKSKIGSDLSVAIKAYNACASFGGTLAPTAAQVTAGTTAMAAGTAVCSGTMSSDTTEAAASTANWPTLDSGYKYVANGANNVVQVHDTSDTANVTFICSISACTKGTAW
jgi:prepilin-type N-terminal cleavage/methylation domain-containing protein